MAESIPEPRTSLATRVPWAGVVVYIVIAFGLAWLVALPLWLHDGLRNPLAKILLIVMMHTPAAAALIVVLAIQRPRPPSILEYLGIWPLAPFHRTVLLCVVGIVGGALLIIAGAFLAAALGVVRLDLVHFSGFRDAIERTTGRALPQPAVLLVGAQLVAVPFAAVFNGFATIGEELGWRGWLLPSLRPLGTWTALVISGAIWGLWHAPIILLGYNFDQPNLLGVAMMTGATILLGTLVGWLRLRSASVWPCVFAHGAVNATGGFVVLVSTAGVPIDPVAAGPLGWATWIVMAVVIAVLAATGQFQLQPRLQRSVK
ncbi:MAG: CPBP family intramembrane metalloprotease [Chloroflexi bacterium]|nr:CPBP family intramembrane metalloprotease [Chloroflexota bacterium]